MSEPPQIELSVMLQDPFRIADEIWGRITSDDPEQAQKERTERMERLESFFVLYRNEHDLESKQYDDTLAIIRIIKRSPEDRKLELRRQFDADPTTDGVAADTSSLLLDLTVRSMFMTACARRAQSGAEILSGDTIFRPSWKESESIARYLGRVFPKSQPPQQDLLSFKADKLRASYLQTYASIQIEWTDYLSDHLILLKGETWKKLYIFRHPRFIQVSLETLAKNAAGLTQSFVEAVKLGCLREDLLEETLLTLDLIFPVVADDASRTILEKHVRKRKLDPYLLDRVHPDDRYHERPGDAIEPRDIKSLYERYPFWADRLYEIWREADDPTPITRIERWSEARRNPRFTYWCTVVSIMLAITFGMLSIGLAAAQLWIAWCDWVDDPTRAQCGYKRASADASGTD